MREYDAIVIGAGIIGAAASYYLAKEGLKVAIVDKDHPAAGASGACNGGLSYLGKKGDALESAYQSLLIYKNLAQELNYPLEICQSELLVLLAETQEELAELEQGVKECSALGLDAEMVNQKRLGHILPGITTKPIGGAIAQGGLHGFANPFSIVNGYLAKAKELGGMLYQNWEVETILTAGARVAGVKSGEQVLFAPIVVNCAGVEASNLLEGCNVSMNIIANRGVVLVTEIVPWNLPAKIMSANFGTSSQKTVSLAIEQTLHGNILIGSSHEIGVGGRQVSSELLAGIASNAISYYPKLATTSIIRTFTGLRPYREEGMFLGKIDNYAGLYVASGHGGSGITMAPWTGSTLAQAIAC